MYTRYLQWHETLALRNSQHYRESLFENRQIFFVPLVQRNFMNRALNSFANVRGCNRENFLFNLFSTVAQIAWRCWSNEKKKRTTFPYIFSTIFSTTNFSSIEIRRSGCKKNFILVDFVEFRNSRRIELLHSSILFPRIQTLQRQWNRLLARNSTFLLPWKFLHIREIYSFFRKIAEICRKRETRPAETAERTKPRGLFFPDYVTG